MRPRFRPQNWSASARFGPKSGTVLGARFRTPKWDHFRTVIHTLYSKYRPRSRFWGRNLALKTVPHFGTNVARVDPFWEPKSDPPNSPAFCYKKQKEKSDILQRSGALFCISVKGTSSKLRSFPCRAAHRSRHLLAHILAFSWNGPPYRQPTSLV